MQAITGITNQPCQTFNLTPGDGSTATMTIAYRPNQSGWFYSLVWNGTTPSTAINGRRITNYPNLLRQFENILSFGLACVTLDGYEPLGANDFSSGYATLYLLSQDDIAAINAAVFPGK